MKSTFTIDFADLTGNGIEPILNIYIGDEGCVEDKLVRLLFQSANLFEVNYFTPEKQGGNVEERPNSYLTLSKYKPK